MTNNRTITSFVLIAACFLLSYSPIKKKSAYNISLKYYPQSVDENPAKTSKGLMWTLSYLGAEFPVGSLDKSIMWRDSATIELQLLNCGLPITALEHWKAVISQIKGTDKYKRDNGIDVGIFSKIVLGSPENYYAFVEMPEYLSDLLPDTLSFPDTSKLAAGESLVALHERMVILPDSNENPIHSKFLGIEGDLKTNTISVDHTETLDLMPNGQVRVGIFDKEGKRINEADPRLSSGGRPAKCLWCHEVFFAAPFGAKTDYEGYMSLARFFDRTKKINAAFTEYRKELETDFHHELYWEHEYAELLYLKYEEPSFHRLMQETELDSLRLSTELVGIPMHINQEHPHMGELYYRKDLPTIFQFKEIDLTTSSR